MGYALLGLKLLDTLGSTQSLDRMPRMKISKVQRVWACSLRIEVLGGEHFVYRYGGRDEPALCLHKPYISPVAITDVVCT